MWRGATNETKQQKKKQNCWRAIFHFIRDFFVLFFSGQICPFEINLSRLGYFTFIHLTSTTTFDASRTTMQHFWVFFSPSSSLFANCQSNFRYDGNFFGFRRFYFSLTVVWRCVWVIIIYYLLITRNEIKTFICHRNAHRTEIWMKSKQINLFPFLCLTHTRNTTHTKHQIQSIKFY